MSIRACTAGLLVVGLLLGACGDDDGGADARPEGACARIDGAALAAAIDVELDVPEADETSCRFGSGGSDARIGFSYTVLEGVSAETAVRAVRQSCDADTAVDLVPEAGRVAFGCRVQHELTVAVADDEHLAVLAALGLGSEVADADRYAALLRVADRAFAPVDKT